MSERATWGKTYADLWRHPKWVQLEPGPRALWVTALSWTVESRTFGSIPTPMLVMFRATAEDAAALVEAGLWEESEDGYQMHDWDDHQTSRERFAATSKRRAEAGRKGGKARHANRTEKPVTSDDRQFAKQTAGNGQAEVEVEVEVEEQLSPLPPQGGELLLSPEPPRKRSGARVYPDAFEVLWSVWPKTGDTKRTAYTAWEKATRGSSRIGPRVSESELLEAVKRFAADPNLPGPAENRFIPALSVWINQDRWENGPLPPRGGPGGGRPDPLSQGLATAARLRAEREAREQQTRPQYPHLTSRRTA